MTKDLDWELLQSEVCTSKFLPSLYASFIFRKHSMQSEEQKHDMHYLLEIRRKSAFTSNFILHSYKCRICIMYKNFSTLLTLCNSKTFEKCLLRREGVWGIFYSELIKYWSIWIQRYLKGINFCGINLSRNWFSRICHFRKFCGITFCEFRNFWKFTKPFFVVAFCTISEIFGR